MMMIDPTRTPTLILHPRFDEDSQLVWQAAVSAGWRIERMTHYEPGAVLDTGGPIAIYGGWLWGQEMAKHQSVHLTTPCDDWLLRVPPDLLGRKCEMKLGRELEGLAFPRFIKSAQGKSIDSRVYHSVDDLPPSVYDEAFYIAQEPVRWDYEFRSFIVDGKVLTTAVYSRLGELCTEDPVTAERWRGAQAWLNSVLAELPLIYSMVIDVGYIPQHGWAVVEANPAWCSGIYGCDPDAVLTAALAAVMENRVDGSAIRSFWT